MPEAAGTSPAPFRPLGAGDRLTHLDVVRGFALLGVLLMNNQYWFRAPSARYQLAAHPWPGAADAVVDVLLQWLWSGKSMSLFALLFGLGLTLQLERARGRGADFGGFVRRRQCALLLIGLLHIALLWSGDILHVYALLGLALVPWMDRPARTLVRWAVVLEAVYLAQFIMPRTGPHPAAAAASEAWIALSRAAYLHGSWREAAAFRWSELAHLYTRAGAWFWPGLYGLFLLGSAVWRSGAVQDPEGHLPLLRRARAWGLGLGLMMEGLDLLLPLIPGLALPPWSKPLLGMLYRLGEPVLALGYGAALILLVRDPRWARALRGLAAMGKLILTNYLLQSLVMTWIYNGYGLGLYDRLGPFHGLLLALALYAAQIAFSLWWVARFQFGPVEWLWRGISYGSFPALRRDPATA
ncbi:MAG TPA: DUF418 domain-containing protein [Holophagaceae bacterium]|nr:DUF418 domain-containing protein [Holophagaceae bacterium]